MQQRRNTLRGAQGAPSEINKTNFFSNNDSNGIGDATAFLDVYHPMSANSKQKYAYFWELLRDNTNMVGMLQSRIDKNNIPYAWVEMELPRGIIPFKVVLLSPQMFDFLVRYQRAQVTVRFTLQELVAEAERIEKTLPPVEPKVL